MIAQTVSYVVHDAAGRILRFGRAAASDVPQQAGPGEAVLIGAGDNLHDWVNPATGLLEQRPATGLPETATVAAGAEWEISPAPPGTVVVVDGDEVLVVDDDDLVLQFPVAASWRVDLRPPFPWRPATCAVTTV